MRGVSERRVRRPRESIHRDPASASTANHHHHHHHHHEQLTRCFFVKTADLDNCVYYLLPANLDSEIISSLRSAKEYPSLCAKTTQFKKTIHSKISETGCLHVIV